MKKVYSTLPALSNTQVGSYPLSYCDLAGQLFSFAWAQTCSLAAVENAKSSAASQRNHPMTARPCCRLGASDNPEHLNHHLFLPIRLDHQLHWAKWDLCQKPGKGKPFLLCCFLHADQTELRNVWICWKLFARNRNMAVSVSRQCFPLKQFINVWRVTKL